MRYVFRILNLTHLQNHLQFGRLTRLLLLSVSTSLLVSCDSTGGDPAIPMAESHIVTIVWPDVDSLLFFEGEHQTIRVMVSDSSQRTVIPEEVHWTSTLDGLVGTTNRLYTSDLSVGSHTIALSVTFADQSTSTIILPELPVIADPWASTDLANDHELRTTLDPNAPYVRDEWTSWIRANRHILRSLDSEDFSDLGFLSTLLEDKTIVQMGEAAHGIAEHNRIRVRLIKYLHEVLGFNVVAFESGLYECYFTNNAFDTLSARNALLNSLYTFWHTSDLLDLFDYVASTRNTPNPLFIAGFDVQPTGYFHSTRPVFFQNLLLPIDSLLADSVFKYETVVHELDYYDLPPYISSRYDMLVALYDQLVETLEVNVASLTVSLGSESAALTAIEMARSAGDYIRFRSGDLIFNSKERVAIRDGRMADNLIFLREHLFPGEKTIVWAHNGHIMKNTTAIIGVDYTEMMGQLLDAEYPGEVFSIGALMYRGAIDLSGQRHSVNITAAESMEAIMYSARVEQFFLDISTQTSIAGNAWLFQNTSQRYHHRNGNFDIWYVPKDQYDAIIFVDTVNPPGFLR